MAKKKITPEASGKSAEFADVFKANPDLERIYVVGDMPFADKTAAENYAFSENRTLHQSMHLTVETVENVAEEKAEEKAADVGDGD